MGKNYNIYTEEQTERLWGILICVHNAQMDAQIRICAHHTICNIHAQLSTVMTHSSTVKKEWQRMWVSTHGDQGHLPTAILSLQGLPCKALSVSYWLYVYSLKKLHLCAFSSPNMTSPHHPKHHLCSNCGHKKQLISPYSRERFFSGLRAIQLSLWLKMVLASCTSHPLLWFSPSRKSIFQLQGLFTLATVWWARPPSSVLPRPWPPFISLAEVWG